METYRLKTPFEHGEDLKKLQKALHNDKFYYGSIDGIFGAGTAHACSVAKWHLGYPKKKVIPSGGQVLLDYLNGNVGLPLAYRIRRHARGFGIRKSDSIRQELVKWAMWGAKNSAEIHYTESGARVNWLWHGPGFLPMDTDCSGFVTACYKWSKQSDPNDLNYRTVGYTGTLLTHGTHIPLSQAKPGDLVIWYSMNEPTGHHVAILVQPGHFKNPMIVSHGSEIGPLYIPLSEEQNAQQRPFVVRQYVRG